MLKKDIFATFAGQFLNIGLVAISTIILARWLGVYNRGLYALALLLPRTIGSVVLLGQNAVNSTFPGLHRDQRPALFVQTIYLSVVAGGLGMLAMAAYMFWLPVDRGYMSELSFPVVMVAMLLIPVELVSALLRELARGAEHIVGSAIVSVIGSAVQVIGLLVVLVVFHRGVLAAVLVTLAAPVVTAAINIYQIRGFATLDPRAFSRRIFRESMKFGGIIAISGTAIYLIGQTGQFLLNYMKQIANVSMSDIGIYAVAYSIGIQVGIVPTSVAQAFLPRMSNNQDRLQQTPRVFRLTFLATTGMLLLLGLLGPPAIYVILGPEYMSAVWPFLALLPGVGIFGGFRVLGMYLWVRKKPQYGMVSNWISLLITGAVSLLLIPVLGTVGAALGNTLGMLALSVMTAWAYHRESKVPYSELVPRKEDFLFIGSQAKAIFRRLTGRRPAAAKPAAVPETAGQSASPPPGNAQTPETPSDDLPV